MTSRFYKVNRDIESIDNLCINPIPRDRINTQVIYRFTLAKAECKSHVLLNNCKQNITSLSLLVGITVNFEHDK